MKNLSPHFILGAIGGALCGILFLGLIAMISWDAITTMIFSQNTYPEPPTSGEVVFPETTVTKTSTPEPTPAYEITDTPHPVGLETVSEAPAKPEDEPIDETTSCPTPLFTEHILLLDAVQRVQERRAIGVTYVEEVSEGEDPSFYVVFTSGSTRYSVRYWPNGLARRPSLNFWERPDGTSGQRHLITYSDSGVDGCVNFGIGHTQANLLHWNEYSAPPEGVEHHAFWQERYNTAARAFIRATGARRGP